jgi:uncharacterized protein YdaU (DUF1376 family)
VRGEWEAGAAVEGAVINYYERHLGDYARDTAHLSMLEHGAYTVLLDRFYATEQGIPQDQVHRIARARSKDERAAVDAVLAEFFVLEDGAYVQKRALGEISKAQARINAARENGKTGGRPRRNPEETRPEPTGFPDETQVKALQSPPLQSPPSSLRSERAPRPSKRCPEGFVVTDEAKAAMRLECPTVDLEAETRKFRDHTYPVARSDWPATWRNWIRKAAELSAGKAVQAKSPNAPTDRDWTDLRHRADKIGFRAPNAGESVQGYQTLVAREEDRIQRGRSSAGPVGVGKLLEGRA